MRRFVTVLVASLASVLFATPAHAYVTDGLYLYMDARVADSYDASTPGEWNDISPNGRNGTINGSVSYDNSTDALFFDGTSSGTNYVSLSGAFNDWGNGFTIEFIGEFGANLNNWERIFDFGNGPASDNVWVGRLYGTQNLAIEIWDGGSNLGRCHTTGDQLNTRELHHWVITMDDTPTCRIYMDGTEVSTQLQDGSGAEVSSPTLSGTTYPGLPNDVTRSNNFVGASNWEDPDFEGSIQMIRIYNRAISASDVSENDSMAADSGSGSGGDTGGGSHPSKLAATGFDPALPATVALIALGLGFAIRRRTN